MIRHILGELPSWAKRENPLLRYELSRFDPELSRRERIFRVGAWVLFLTILVLAGYFYATDWLQRSMQMPYTLDIWRMLFFPILIIQVIMRVSGLSLAVNSVRDERRRQTWDNLRATEHGAEIALRTRWVSVFYRLRGLILTVMTTRIILIAAILYELTSMQGGYLDLLAAKSDPTISLEMAVILLSALMTAFIMMPITAIGVDIALGLLISTAIRNRAFAGLAQILVLTFRLVSTVVLFWLTWGFMNGDMILGDLQALGIVGAFSALGDWGLVLAQLTRSGQLWADVPYSIFLGFGLLLFMILQVTIASGLLNLAVRFAERNE